MDLLPLLQAVVLSLRAAAALTGNQPDPRNRGKGGPSWPPVVCMCPHLCLSLTLSPRQFCMCRQKGTIVMIYL